MRFDAAFNPFCFMIHDPLQKWTFYCSLFTMHDQSAGEGVEKGADLLYCRQTLVNSTPFSIALFDHRTFVHLFDPQLIQSINTNIDQFAFDYCDSSLFAVQLDLIDQDQDDT
jgi:hypothetical protein